MTRLLFLRVLDWVLTPLVLLGTTTTTTKTTTTVMTAEMTAATTHNNTQDDRRDGNLQLGSVWLASQTWPTRHETRHETIRDASGRSFSLLPPFLPSSLPPFPRCCTRRITIERSRVLVDIPLFHEQRRKKPLPATNAREFQPDRYNGTSAGFQRIRL